MVVPTAGASGPVDGRPRRYVSHLMHSMLGTLSPHDEVVAVVGPEAEPGLSSMLHDDSGGDRRLRVVVDDREFSFSDRVNLAVASTEGDVVLLLNDDTEVLEPDWADLMADAAMTPGVGAVGATLLYEDGTLQHGGLTTIDGLPTHAWSGRDPDDPVDGGVLMVDRLAWGVTGAALAVRRRIWEQLGGFSVFFPVNYNDVDFCCKASHVGLRNVVLASARLRHFETRTRARELPEADVSAIRERWAHRLGPDPLVAGTSALVPVGRPGSGGGSGA